MIFVSVAGKIVTAAVLRTLNEVRDVAPFLTGGCYPGLAWLLNVFVDGPRLREIRSHVAFLPEYEVE